MSTIEIKHGDAVVTVHRRTPRSDMRRTSWIRKTSWIDERHEDYGVARDDLTLSVWAWLNAASRITVDGEIPIPLPNGHEDEKEVRKVFDQYLDIDDPAAVSLMDQIADALRRLDKPADEALAPTPPDKSKKK